MADVDRSDVDLLIAIGERDRGAFTVLYRRHAPGLTLRLSRRCADTDVEDLAVAPRFQLAGHRRSGGAGHVRGGVAQAVGVLGDR